MNDVTALRADPELAGVVADSGAYLCLMHMQGEPRTMQLDRDHANAFATVSASTCRATSCARMIVAPRS